MTDTSVKLTLAPDITILLMGDSGSGKSTLAAELAKKIRKDTGKNTFVFLADEGSREAYALLKQLGVVEVSEPSGNQWVWVRKAFEGMVKQGNIYVPVMRAFPNTGLIIHESLSEYADRFMREMSIMAADGVNIGGDGIADVEKDAPTPATATKEKGGVLKAWKIDVKEEGKLAFRVGGNSQAHYGIAQRQIREGFLAGRPAVPHIYTAAIRRGDKGFGPMTVGDAQTDALPRWLTYTFHTSVDEKGAHTLHLVPHAVGTIGRVMAVGNARLPLEGESVKVSSAITPASLVRALLEIQARKDAGLAELKKELGL